MKGLVDGAFEIGRGDVNVRAGSWPRQMARAIEVEVGFDGTVVRMVVTPAARYRRGA